MVNTGKCVDYFIDKIIHLCYNLQLLILSVK